MRRELFLVDWVYAIAHLACLFVTLVGFAVGIWAIVKLVTNAYPKRERLVAILLACFLGGLGVHRFYLRHPVGGFLSVLLCCTGIPMVLGVVDAIVLANTDDDTFDARHNT